MTNHIKHIDQIIKSIQQVVNDIIEDDRRDHNLIDAASTVNKARQPLEKAKGQLEKKAKERKRYLLGKKE